VLRSVTTYYLEMRLPQELRPSEPRDPRFRAERAEIACPELNRFFYTAVGRDWYWTDRLGWSYQRWAEYVQRPEIETWVGWLAGSPAGYFELEALPERQVRLAYFGLLPQFIGRGIGGALLTAAVRRAWEPGPERVKVNTCTLDSPAALRNYQARGFLLCREETRDEALPDQPPGPWPGAR